MIVKVQDSCFRLGINVEGLLLHSFHCSHCSYLHTYMYSNHQLNLTTTITTTNDMAEIAVGIIKEASGEVVVQKVFIVKESYSQYYLFIIANALSLLPEFLPPTCCLCQSRKCKDHF
jgi:hypothetical protein